MSDTPETPEEFCSPAESLVIPMHRDRIVTNNLTGERLARLFDILAADAEATGEPIVAMPLTWERKDDPDLEVGCYKPQLFLVVEKIESQPEKDLTDDNSEDILEG